MDRDSIDVPIKAKLLPINALQLTLKRLIDIIGSIFGLIVFSLPAAIMAIAIRMESPGPAIYKRTIVGKNNENFVYYKLRSMIDNADEWLDNHPELKMEYHEKLKIKNDPRITRLGNFLRRTSLDEVPQFYNILKGEMSLVGPRTLSEAELHAYGFSRDKVLSVKPGLTGLWQVSGRQTTSLEKRIALDMEYIDNWSLWLDVKILFRTVWAVVTMKGAH